MKELTSFEFTDYFNLTDPEILNAIKELCEFEEIENQYFIDIVSKSHYKQTILYKIRIYDLSTGA